MRKFSVPSECEWINFLLGRDRTGTDEYDKLNWIWKERERSILCRPDMLIWHSQTAPWRMRQTDVTSSSLPNLVSRVIDSFSQQDGSCAICLSHYSHQIDHVSVLAGFRVFRGDISFLLVNNNCHFMLVARLQFLMPPKGSSRQYFSDVVDLCWKSQWTQSMAPEP